MRILSVLICFFGVATASEIQLEDGRIVSGSLAIFSEKGAKIINHGATPDEFYTWAEISAVGLGSHEQSLRNGFLQESGNSAPTKQPTPRSNGKSVDLTEIFSRPASAGTSPVSATAPAQSRAQGPPSQSGSAGSPPNTQRLPQKTGSPATADPITLDELMTGLDSLKQHPVLTRSFGLLVAGGYLALALVVFLLNFTSKKKLGWAEKPETIKKAVNTAFGATCIIAIASCGTLHFFADKIGFDPLPLWQAASALGIAVFLALGLRAKSRTFALILLAAAVGGSARAFYEVQLSDVTLLKSSSFLIAFLITSILIDAVFAIFHYRARQKESANKKPLPQMDTADAAA